MSEIDESLKKIEDRLIFDKKAFDEHGANLPQAKKVENYKERKSTLKFSLFIMSANTHYFASRILFLQGLEQYSLFSAQQCVENYLKAYMTPLQKGSPQKRATLI